MDRLSVTFTVQDNVDYMTRGGGGEPRPCVADVHHCGAERLSRAACCTHDASAT